MERMKCSGIFDVAVRGPSVCISHAVAMLGTVNLAAGALLLTSGAFTFVRRAQPVIAPAPTPFVGKRGVSRAFEAVGRFSQRLRSIGRKRSIERVNTDGADKILDALDSMFGRTVLRQLFRAVDSDRDGRLDLEEALIGLRRIPGLADAPRAQLEEVARRADHDGDGVSFDEVLGCPRAQRRPLVERALLAFGPTQPQSGAESSAAVLTATSSVSSWSASWR